ncbi:ATP-grasp domain-containing protein [Enterobacter sp. CC120223-11]|uniref:ATP-grasp domain-containing protein n=1 Tax=Enterobacter sp. CC120223-11 TaxID=1378073 RepID=UPI000BD27181|nr:ATP-grasp domain-containing protein [Enterobacter sp. CC120223-11]SNY79680.1 ATP-grasp domain-containing protein [Enterobacter sp. CC120223-11]
MINVLISPAGTEIGREIWQSLRFDKSVRLFLAGEDYDNHARYYDCDYHLLPGITSDNWLSALQTFISRHEIHYIFPAHDDVLFAYAQKQENIAARVITSNAECCEITRYKSLTYKALADVIHVPRCYETVEEITEWPVFVKPDRGQGAQGAVKIADETSLRRHLAEHPGVIICEYLSGAEYTVDCFSNAQGVIFCQPRTRERIRAGISMGSKRIEIEGVREMAEKISTRLNLRGAWFFQLKYSNDSVLTLLEVAPRIAGTMALNRVRGVNFPLLSLYEHQNIAFTLPALLPVERISRALSNRYRSDITFSHVYVDFDDTLIIHQKLCLPLIAFLYQCVNEGIPLSLLTRHRGDIYQQLNKWRLTTLFDRVYHLTEQDKKSSYITEPDAIFIDDSFRERDEVHRSCGIYTFDISMLDVLIKE